MNEMLKKIEERYSCRDFSNHAISDADLRAIANAAVTSPSAMNTQPWRVTVVNDKSLIDDMENVAMSALERADRTAYMRIKARGGKLFYNAPNMIMLPVESARMPGALLDLGIVCQTVTLAAESLGLSTLICGLARFAFTEEHTETFASRLAFPSEFEFGIAILIGYPSEQFALSAKPHEPDYGKISYV